MFHKNYALFIDKRKRIKAFCKRCNSQGCLARNWQSILGDTPLLGIVSSGVCGRRR